MFTFIFTFFLFCLVLTFSSSHPISSLFVQRLHIYMPVGVLLFRGCTYTCLWACCCSEAAHIHACGRVVVQRLHIYMPVGELLFRGCTYTCLWACCCSEVAHIHACGRVVAATSVRFGLVAVRAFVTI